MMPDFHEILFPMSVALAGSGGPERLTDVTITGSGSEDRIARWAHSRRRYDAGSGVKTFEDLQIILEFFEERRGRLYGFRWRDRLDYSSARGNHPITAFDQKIAIGDGVAKTFPLIKTYGSRFEPYQRLIRKPVAQSVKIAIGGQEAVPGSDILVDSTDGTITCASAPAAGQMITAGYLFDVPVRFDTDRLDVDYAAFAAGEIVKIPLVELLR